MRVLARHFAGCVGGAAWRRLHWLRHRHAVGVMAAAEKVIEREKAFDRVVREMLNGGASSNGGPHLAAAEIPHVAGARLAASSSSIFLLPNSGRGGGTFDCTNTDAPILTDDPARSCRTVDLPSMT